MFVYKNTITIESGKRSGKPCIRGMRITVEDILRYLASGMNREEIVEDFPEPKSMFRTVNLSLDWKCWDWIGK